MPHVFKPLLGDIIDNSGSKSIAAVIYGPIVPALEHLDRFTSTLLNIMETTRTNELNCVLVGYINIYRLIKM